MRKPVEKMPLCLLKVRMLLLGKVQSRPRHESRSVSGVADSVANGQLVFSIPSLAPPVCENVAVIAKVRNRLRIPFRHNPEDQCLHLGNGFLL